MKKISVLIPCYNEQENVVQIATAIKEHFAEKLADYTYEILFIDNDSNDNTQKLLRELCSKDKNIKAIFNAKNFGQFNSPQYGMLQTSGDCTIVMCCDFQDPIEMIEKFVKEWEQGSKIVIGIKSKSKENKLMRFFRSIYYSLIKRCSKVEQIKQFTGFGLYDKSFIEVMKNLTDPTPILRGIVAELGYKVKKIEYTQAKRRAGKTSNNFATLYDAAMLNFTNYTKTIPRVCTFFGISLFLLSVVGGILFGAFTRGDKQIIYILFCGVFCVLGMLSFFLGYIAEYIMATNLRLLNRPLVIESERINFEE